MKKNSLQKDRRSIDAEPLFLTVVHKIKFYQINKRNRNWFLFLLDLFPISSVKLKICSYTIYRGFSPVISSLAKKQYAIWGLAPIPPELKSLIASQKRSLNNYMQQIENIKVGRPAIGVTKKVSLTLSEEEWEWLDEHAKDNRSAFLRELVSNARESHGIVK